MVSAINEIKQAATALKSGGLAVMPTETVYGLAGDATNENAVVAIFAAKGRPQFNPLIVHVFDAAMATTYVAVSPLARSLMDSFWPGPLTLVLPRKDDCDISLLVSAGLDSLAIRAPAHDIARQLIQHANRPLAAPSANLSGAISPTQIDHIHPKILNQVDSALDGGPCVVGVESTIVSVKDDVVTLLRPGGIARHEIEGVIGKPVRQSEKFTTPLAPGMLDSHYAPKSPLRMDANTISDGEAYLGFGDEREENQNHPHGLNLSPSGHFPEAAKNLFSYLHQLDEMLSLIHI